MSLELQSPDPIERIATLARQTQATVEIMPLPTDTLPPSPTVKAPGIAVVIDGKGAVDIKSLKPYADEYRSKPVFREGTATATTLDSFIDLVNRHANADSAIFVDANWRAPKFTAVIDYHQAVAAGQDRPKAEAGEDPLARRGQHRITYAFPLSEPWKVWVANSGKAMAQEEFAAFLEEHIHEVAAKDPQSADEAAIEEMFKTKIADPAALLDLSRGLEVHVGAKVKSKVRLQSGETQMVFETEHRDADGNEVNVPGLFLVSVPAFYRGDVMRIPARLRYRAGAAITWSYELYRPDEFIDEHVRKAVETVAATTGLPTYDGAPETR